jgi:dipeptidyl aminopeptidase/acylaminoacyl peptidase
MRCITHAVSLATVLVTAAAAFGQGELRAISAPSLQNPESISVDAVPMVTVALKQALNRYQNFRPANFGDWASSGKGMYILTRFADVPQVHLVSWPMKARTQLTFLPERIQGVLARPGRDQFLYVTDEGGAENGQFYLQNPAGGEPVRLTDGKSRNIGPKWSRAGDAVAWSSNARNGRDMDLYVAADADPKRVRLLKEVSGDWQVADWSPDGSKIAAVEYLSINESYITIVDVATGRTEPLTPRPEDPKSEKVSASDPKWSADGQSVFYLTDQGSEFRGLVRRDLTTGKVEPQKTIPGDVEDYALSDDGKYLAVVVNEEGFSRLLYWGFDNNGVQMLLPPAGPRGIISGLKFRPGENEFAFTLSSARSTADAYTLPLSSNGRLVRWTQSETGGLDAEKFAEPELIKYPSFDGRQTPAFVYRPPANKFPAPRPVMIDIHGGPESQFRPGFLGRLNYWIDELGLVLIFPNVRGSSGYGKSALKADNGMKRMDAVKDIGALFDWISAQPGLDKNRIGVTGGSYGGFMSLAVQANFNDKIKAGIDIVGISNFVTFLKNTQGYRRDLRRAEYGDERDPEMSSFLERISPLGQAEKIRTPILVVQGRNDPRVPYSEATQLITALKKNGTTVWTVIGENEGHGFAKKVNQDFLQATEVSFLRLYLLGETAAQH